jgi:hypothetical protein
MGILIQARTPAILNETFRGFTQSLHAAPQTEPILSAAVLSTLTTSAVNTTL